MPASVAIVIPCFNHNEAVKKAIQSLHDLSTPPSQVVVIDDGSDVPVDVTSVSSGLNLTVVRTRNQGLAAARNEGLKRVSSDWVIFLDSDDVLHANALDMPSTLVSEVRADVLTSAFVLHQQGRQSTVFPLLGDPVAALLQCHIGPIHSFAFRTETLKKLGGFSTEEVLRKGHEDYDMMVRIALHEGRFLTQHIPVCTYEKLPGSMSTHQHNMCLTRLHVWLRFFMQLTQPSPQRLMHAVAFFARHYQDFAVSYPDSIPSVLQKLMVWRAETEVSAVEWAYCISSLPGKIIDVLGSASGPTGKSQPVIQEIFDWRAQPYTSAILLQRLSELAQYAGELECKRVAIWGANALAEQAIAVLQLSMSVTIIDSNRAGERLSGLSIVSPDDINFSGDWPILIAAHQAFSDIAAQLAAMNVETKRIF